MSQKVRYIIYAILIVWAFAYDLSHATESSLRCGNDLVQDGDRMFIVVQKCGEPVEKMFTGWTLDKREEREFKMEEWVYGPKNGYYYFISFVGGQVVSVKSVR